MSDAQTANNFRRGVEAAGGRREIGVRALREAFGRSRLTDKAREEMESALLQAGVSIEPSLADVDLNDRVLLLITAGSESTPREVPSPPAIAPVDSVGGDARGSNAGPQVAGVLGLLATLLAFGSFGADGGLLMLVVAGGVVWLMTRRFVAVALGYQQRHVALTQIR